MMPRHTSSSRTVEPQPDPNLATLEFDAGTACEVCGNHYDKPIEILRNGISHYFDCFECAIHALAPKCEHCDCRIIGHGVESSGVMFCCAHCASKKGVAGITDRT